jgi:7,8-dihydropterin-6-yl-methyl-4-(beta-D-ribofuranosyl)aminobenzene 5'-phosphate synthase
MIGIPYLNNLGISKSEVIKIGERLNNPKIKKIVTCHCTGKKAFSILKRQLGEKLERISTGQEIVLD